MPYLLLLLFFKAQVLSEELSLPSSDAKKHASTEAVEARLTLCLSCKEV